MNNITKFFKRYFGVSARNSKSVETQRIIDRKIQMALEKWILENKVFDPNLGLKEIADQFDVDRTQLNHYFVVNYGTSFLKWRRRYRMVEAAEILARDPYISIADVARIVGVPDKTNFKRQFMVEIGFGPAEWRKSL